MDTVKLFLIIATLSWLPTIYTNIVYLNSISGSDNVTCGAMTSPCKSLDTTWYKFLWSKNFTGQLTFLLKPGSYYMNPNMHHSLSYTCSESVIGSLSLVIDGNSTTEYVQIYHSFELASCQVSYKGIQFIASNIKTTDSTVNFTQCIVQNKDSSFTFLKSNFTITQTVFKNLTSKSQILALRSQRVLFANCSFISVSLTRNNIHFIDIDNAKSVHFEHMEFVNNSGLEFTKEKMKLLSLKNVELFDMKHVHLRKNKNLIFDLTSISQTSGFNWIIADNINTTMVFKDSKTTATNIFLRRNLRSVVDWNSVLVFDGNSITLEVTCDLGNRDRSQLFKQKQCGLLCFRMKLKNPFFLSNDLTMHCEHLKHRDKLGSPVEVKANTRIQCTNCTTKYCHKLCLTGYENVKEILCKECAVGMSARDWEKTCKKCRQGHYSPSTGASDCIPCSKGTYCNHLGCTKCTKCNNELFTAPKAASSCTQTSTFFKILLGFIICLVMFPIAVMVIRKNPSEEDSDVVGHNKSSASDVSKNRTRNKLLNQERYKHLKNEKGINKD